MKEPFFNIVEGDLSRPQETTTTYTAELKRIGTIWHAPVLGTKGVDFQLLFFVIHGSVLERIISYFKAFSNF